MSDPLTKTRYRDDLAWVHHTGFADLARGAAPELIRLLKKRGIRAGTVVDLGCGSGLILAALARAGYSPFGVDLSNAMLSLAKHEAPGATLRRGSLYSAALPRCRAVFAVGEPLNYVDAGAKAAREAALPPFFRKVARALEPGGVFAFDVIVRGRPSLTRARTVRGEGFDLFVTTTDQGAVLFRDVVCFARKPDAKGYSRSHELHRVRVLETRALLKQLRAAGFSVHVSSGYGRHGLPVRRRAFVCVRR
jgi:SAM-dependent methyltransferase